MSVVVGDVFIWLSCGVCYVCQWDGYMLLAIILWCNIIIAVGFSVTCVNVMFDYSSSEMSDAEDKRVWQVEKEMLKKTSAGVAGQYIHVGRSGGIVGARGWRQDVIVNIPIV